MSRTVRECTGECCRSFPVGNMHMVDIQRLATKEGVGGDVHKIAAILIPNGIHARSGQPAFTCMHWDETTKRCRNYMHRPRMCSEYPYERTCEHCQA